jgi:hypothetical protein
MLPIFAIYVFRADPEISEAQGETRPGGPLKLLHVGHFSVRFLYDAISSAVL